MDRLLLLPPVVGYLRSLAIVCPNCRSDDVRRSHRTVLDRLFAGLLLPWRCERCDRRWYRFTRFIVRIRLRDSQPPPVS